MKDPGLGSEREGGVGDTVVIVRGTPWVSTETVRS